MYDRAGLHVHISYGNGKRTSGIVRIAKDMDTSITGRHVLIIEDIMDSGHTLKHLKKVLEARARLP